LTEYWLNNSAWRGAQDGGLSLPNLSWQFTPSIFKHNGWEQRQFFQADAVGEFCIAVGFGFEREELGCDFL
jgi:hypothetical protein